jgi:glycosyltransferase involved in cell wall biosynthesis
MSLTESLVPAERVLFVGQRYGHHAGHSGYEAFGRYVGSALRPPVRFRWLHGRIGWPLSKAFARVTRHPWYSIGAHLTEWAAFGSMLTRRQCVFHVLYGDSDLWLLRRAHRLTRNHLVASFHQPTADLEPLGALPRVARHLDAAVLVSNAQRAYFEQYLPAGRVFVVPHGVDTDFFSPPRAPREAPVCITVGSHLRDFATLREAILRIWQACPQMRFIAVGTRSDPKSLFPEVADERIRFLDRISDEMLLQAYRSARVAMFAFRDATANNAMLEAMATGLPVVATDIGGIREYVTPGTGLLCPPGDPDALAAAALRLLETPTLARQMGQVARGRAVELDFRDTAVRMNDVYARVLGG